MNPCIETLRQSNGFHPLNLEARLFLAVLNADNLAHLERMLNVRKQSAFATQVRGDGLFEKRLAVCVHAKGTDGDVGGYARFWPLVHKFCLIISSCVESRAEPKVLILPANYAVLACKSQ